MGKYTLQPTMAEVTERSHLRDLEEAIGKMPEEFKKKIGGGGSRRMWQKQVGHKKKNGMSNVFFVAGAKSDHQAPAFIFFLEI